LLRKARRMRDGETIAADLIVLATGYKGQQHLVRKLFGDHVADRVGPIWDFGENQNCATCTPAPRSRASGSSQEASRKAASTRISGAADQGGGGGVAGGRASITDFHRHCEKRSDEAIQSLPRTQSGLLRCASQ